MAGKNSGLRTRWGPDNPPPAKVQKAIDEAVALAVATGEVRLKPEPPAKPWDSSPAGRLAVMRKVAGQLKGMDRGGPERAMRVYLEGKPGEFFREMDRLAKEVEAPKEEKGAEAVPPDARSAGVVALIEKLLRPLEGK